MKTPLRLLAFLLFTTCLSHAQVTVTANAASTSNCNGVAYFTPPGNQSYWGWRWTSHNPLLPNPTLLQTGDVRFDSICPGEYYEVHLDSAGIETAIYYFEVLNMSICYGSAAAVGIVHPSAAGSSDGGFTIYTLGSAPNAYEWWSVSDSANLNSGSIIFTNLASNLPAGPYAFTTFDSGNCGTTDTVNLIAGAPAYSAPAFQATLTQTNGGLCEGSATVSLSGPSAMDPGCVWFNGAMTQSIGGLCPNQPGEQYSVHVFYFTPAYHDTTIYFTVTEPCSGFSAIAASSEDTLSIAVTAGNGPFVANWWLVTDSLGVNGMGISATGLSEGNYAYTVTDANGCSAGGTFSIDLSNVFTPADFEITLQTTDDLTGSCSGTAAVVITGPLPDTSVYLAYGCTWSNGETPHNIDDLCPGNYMVYVFYAYGSGPSGGYLQAQFNFTIFGPCNNLVTNSSSYEDGFTLTATGGVGSLTADWWLTTDSSAVNGSGFSGSGLSDGNYTYVVTDANGCSLGGTFTITITEIPDLELSVTTLDDTDGLCSGSAQATVMGGVPPYTYNWEPGSTAYYQGGLCEGEYSVSVSDAAATILTTSFVISGPDLTFGYLPYVDSVVNDTLYGELFEDCTLDYGSIDSAGLYAAALNGDNLVVTWVVFTDTVVTYLTDTLVFTGGNGVYTLWFYATCPGKAVSGILRIFGQVYIFEDTALGIAENTSFEVAVSPNPTTGCVTLAAAAGFDGASLRVLDAYGQLIGPTRVLHGKSVQVDLSQQASGVYFLEVNRNGLVSRTRVIRN